MLLKGYLTVEQIAKKLGLSEYRVRELIREKQIRATKIGQWRVKPEDLKKFIKSRTNKWDDKDLIMYLDVFMPLREQVSKFGIDL